MSIPNMLPVFTLTPPVSIPSDTNIAFSPRPDGKSCELIIPLPSAQYFCMYFLRQFGFIMACCRWGHILDFADNGLDGSPKEWYLSARLYGKDWERLSTEGPMHDNDYANAIGHLLELSQGIYRDITRSDAIRFKEDFRTLTGIDKLDTSYDISSLFREEFTESTTIKS